MADSGFPLPISSSKELVKVIQGYGRYGKDASLSDIAALTAMPETVISGNNKFLLGLAIIQGGKRKVITPIGAELANALDHDLPDEVSSKWRTVVETNDFLQKVVASVRIRKGMDESSLESHVAYSAGQPKTPVVATGAGAVVEILKKAGMLKEESGNLVAITPDVPSIPQTVRESLSLSDSLSNIGEPEVGRIRIGSVAMGGVRVTIEVNVQCTPKDLDDLGPKLRKVIQDFHDAGDPQKNTPPDENK
jgi:hypothetical protein